MPRRTPGKIRLQRSQAVPGASRESSRERRDASREPSQERRDASRERAANRAANRAGDGGMRAGRRAANRAGDGGRRPKNGFQETEKIVFI
ncbi:hypothetical protein CesoFtcFv8_003498 [Champsocephalus esox]|uniref:Uncharacterized protein n=1 Tax=Champsocephalus esox TaxID=159716 RepID=A0AAN8CSQ2_9TELE|nr:hypothetical protein CesoFtcFv8_003498 [Champsocephalus esox]